jgi:hypothetical protein
MGSGYVLDFTDRSFATFFREHGVDIDAPVYKADGTSKAKRLRVFLRTATPPLPGRVLAALLAHRMAWKPIEVESDLEAFVDVVRRFGGEPPTAATKLNEQTHEAAENELLSRVFKPDALAKLRLDAALVKVLDDRMREAQRCIKADACLSSVILCGSVLEGLCLGYGSRQPERMNRAYQTRYEKTAPRFHEWRLQTWIDVLTDLGDLSLNVGKFGHALRDFRNYVHPAEQLANRFAPDQHTARIGFHVVVAAIDDLLTAEAAGGVS